MIFHTKGKYFICFTNLVFYICGVYIFILGFMPLRTTKISSNKLNELPDDPIQFTNTSSFKCRYRRTVFILIDALRADFVIPQSWGLNISSSTFIHISDWMKHGLAVAFTVKTYSPTVTLPRIKTLLSGTLSGFIDTLFNFNAQRMTQDNLISQAHLLKRRLVFYGDNTWLKLFPEEFQRYEGTHSFYVSDYKEVDDNVTRHLEREFSKNDWDMMILHYLGVDHIGHAFGPQSPLMSVKLKEMDTIIFDIWKRLEETNDGSDDLIVICGDHGMTSSGSHGGNTVKEQYTPLLFINRNFKRSKIFSKEISHVDVAVTLSILLGLPIPTNSIGIVIPEVLYASDMSTKEILHALYLNLKHLYNIYLSDFRKEELEQYSVIQEILEEHPERLREYENDLRTDDYLVNKYLDNMRAIKHILVANSGGYNDNLMLFGILMNWLVTILICRFANFDILPTFCVNIAIYILVFYFILWMVLNDALKSLCIVVLILSAYGILKKTICFTQSGYLKDKVYVFLIPLPIIGLTSSSFVEEEHQTWYFLSTTILLWLTQVPLFTILYCILGTVISTNILSSKQQSELNVTSSYKFKGIIIMILLMLIRMFRSWNQTGNKWANLSDISDWLVEERNSDILHTLVAISLLTIAMLILSQLKGNKCHLNFFVFLSGVIWLHIYRCHPEVTRSVWTYFQSNDGSNIEPCFIYTHCLSIFCIITIQSIWTYKTSKPAVRLKRFLSCVIGSWTLLVATICRLHNVPLIAGTLLAERLLNRVTWKQTAHSFSNISAYMFMSMSSFFYVGNSNSISTIDVYTGYTGLTTYQPILVGFFLICNTYSCFVLWLLLAFYRMCCGYNIKNNMIMGDTMKNCNFLLSYRTFTLSVYILVTYMQRHHLFIWSVFAPKLFYELAHSFIYIVVIFFIYLFNL